MKLGRILLAIVTVAASAALVLSYSSRFISPSALWYTALFGLAYFPILLVFLLLTVLWFFVHKRVFWILLVLLLIGWPAHRTSFAMGKKIRSRQIPCRHFQWLLLIPKASISMQRSRTANRS